MTELSVWRHVSPAGPPDRVQTLPIDRLDPVIRVAFRRAGWSHLTIPERVRVFGSRLTAGPRSGTGAGSRESWAWNLRSRQVSRASATVRIAEKKACHSFAIVTLNFSAGARSSPTDTILGGARGAEENGKTRPCEISMTSIPVSRDVCNVDSAIRNEGPTTSLRIGTQGSLYGTRLRRAVLLDLGNDPLGVQWLGQTQRGVLNEV